MVEEQTKLINEIHQISAKEQEIDSRVERMVEEQTKLINGNYKSRT